MGLSKFLSMKVICAPSKIVENSTLTNNNYTMSINKLPKINCYWECILFIGNDGIRNVMARSRFKDILRNLHFSDNTKDDKSDNGYKVRFLNNHFKQGFSNVILFQIMILKTFTSIWWNKKINQEWNNMSQTSQSEFQV